MTTLKIMPEFETGEAALLRDGRQVRILQVLTVNEGTVTEAFSMEPYPRWKSQFDVGDDNFMQDDGYPYTGILYLYHGDHVWGTATGNELEDYSEQQELL